MIDVNRAPMQKRQRAGALQNLAGCRELRAFSLIEILMTVAMLSIIILGLVAMFDQTRRAFTSSMSQVDYLEAGRAATAMMANEMEQMAPAYVPVSASVVTVNNPNFENFFMDVPGSYAPVVQPLADPTDSRTNTLQEFLYVSRYNQYWNVIGYKIDLNGEAAGVGTMYRFSSTNIPVNSTGISSFMSFFTTADPTQTPGFSRVIDGVIDLRVRAFDPAGNLLPCINDPNTYLNRNNNISITTSGSTVTNEPTGYRFRSNAVPAFVELELGVLENRTLQRYYSMTNNMQVAQQYLQNHAGQVHIFRQRIPIRAVDLNAYNALPAYSTLSPNLP